MSLEKPLTATKGTRQLIWLQLGIGMVTVLFCAVAAFVVYPKLRKAKETDTAQKATASRAENNVAIIASSTLARIQLLDLQSRKLSGGQSPELYFWKGGLKKSSLTADVAVQLSTILNERRFLIGDSAPLLGYSTPLYTYVCDHFWFVIAESPGNATATQNEFLALRKKDPRFATAETIDSGPNNPNNGIAIGFFTSHEDALALTREIGVPAFEAKKWGFGPNQPSCPAR